MLYWLLEKLGKGQPPTQEQVEEDDRTRINFSLKGDDCGIQAKIEDDNDAVELLTFIHSYELLPGILQAMTLTVGEERANKIFNEAQDRIHKLAVQSIKEFGIQPYTEDPMVWPDDDIFGVRDD